LYQPTEGAILIDGIDMRQIDPAELRRAAGFVSQDVSLFYGTLKENIAMGAPFAADQTSSRRPRSLVLQNLPIGIPAVRYVHWGAW